MKKSISIGNKVTFESEDGPQIGTVTEIKSDLSNGRSIAVIDVIGTLNRSPWHMPVDQLRLSKAA